ncbi:hypothetical protein SmJEL517_g02376 [Synchytrium microbalum]|uniref:Acetyl-CoA carboxylase n=1 Tax=Synchytrium microbalum TaxID=1806994 RepID=A0A507C6T6_9FUNG|nr:uncharacterized protein SmJEL517_g02376 [Synchytrium microbalum]TPX35058.1 hypothetical protein SmJEL517_g02376 [Synchytrium microbalum]
MAARPIKKLLIANRGEIAIRISQSAKELGIKTVGCYVREDMSHVPYMDEACELNVRSGAAPAASFNDIGALIMVAKRFGADAVHPGYGFVSESGDFAQACSQANILFVGPSPANLRTFGDKITAKVAAKEAGVSVVEGTASAVMGVGEIVAFANKFGYPIILKHANGGGGRGIRIVHEESEIETAYKRCLSEVGGTANGGVFVEQAIMGGRHIEIQILADTQGNVVHLYDRDCSVQRRFQKIVEIAPALNIEAGLRERVFKDAVALAQHVKYAGAGTIEFLVDEKANRHYFMEVNPRLQVEHTITEQVLGLDLVAAQLHIFQGTSLQEMNIIQSKIVPRGVSIQCRITAEDVSKNFQVQTGVISIWQAASGNGTRVDTFVKSGVEITPFFDSMIAKSITTGSSFEVARRKALRAVRETVVQGVKTNIGFLINLLEHPQFIAQQGITTLWVEAHTELMKEAISTAPVASSSTATQSSVDPNAIYVKSGETRLLEINTDATAATGWEEHTVKIHSVVPPGAGLGASQVPHTSISAEIDGTPLRLRLHGPGTAARKVNVKIEAPPGSIAILAPHDGRVVEVLFEEGEDIEEGQEGVVLSLMKMETIVNTAITGRVVKVVVAENDVIKEGAPLMFVQPEGVSAAKL